MEKVEEFIGDLPPCLIYIDKDGRMYHQGAEMTHRGINAVLLAGLDRDESSRYVIEFKGQRCWVEVEDAPLVVRRVDALAGEGFRIYLSDEQEEMLDPSRLWIGPDEAIYTLVRQGRLPARFLRPAYYQLAEHIVEHESGFALADGDRRWPIDHGTPGKMN